MITKIQLRRDIAENWTNANPVLDDGEVGIEKNTRKFKFGNGSTSWNDLPYVIDGQIPTKISQLEDDAGFITINDVEAAGFTKNIGTVTAINNIEPDVNGNVTIAIPTSTEDLSNDSGFITIDDVATEGYTKNKGTVTQVNDSTPDANGNVSLAIPSKTSDLTNDSNFTTLDAVTGQGYAKSIDVAGTYQTKITSSVKLSADLLSEGTTNKLVSASEKTTWNEKQDAINDLDTIRSNASAGKSASDTIATYGNVVTHNTSEFATAGQGTKADTALQPSDLSATSPIAYNSSTKKISVASGYQIPTTTQVGKIGTNETAIATINSKIPSEATSGNQLADKAYVNSTVGTNTANYISNNGQPFTSLAQLQAYTGTVTNNDYAFITGTDEEGNTFYDRYKATVTGTTVSWAKEFRLNNSSFTAAQWAAIESGITSGDVALIGTALQPQDNISELTNDAGYITGISSSDVTGALGYTPYNSTNPNNYISRSGISATSPIAYNNTTGVVSVASGYQIPTAAQITTFTNKQDALVSGTNIKTINGNSVLGSGNISVATTEQGAKADTAVQPATLSGYVPTSRTISGNPLSQDITLTFGDVYFDIGEQDLWDVFDSLAERIGGSFDLAGNFTKDSYQTSGFYPLNNITDQMTEVKAIGWNDRSIGKISDLTTTAKTDCVSAINEVNSLASSAVQPNDNVSDLTNDAGYLTGITGKQVTNALGYTPQQQLESGTNIKTINGNSVLGGGNLEIEGKSNLSELNDVSISSPANGQFLSYNGTNWTNTSLQTTLSSASTDNQVPSAKCVYDLVGNIESTINAIRGV